MGDEFNGNGKKTYLRATQHNTYAPLPQHNVRLTPNFNKFVLVAIGALPISTEEGTTQEEGVGEATGSVANVSKVAVKRKKDKDRSHDVEFGVGKIQLTDGSYLHSKETPEPKTEKDILEDILPEEDDIPYAEELTVEQVERLLRHFFDKIEWSTAEDTEYIAKLMIEAQMITRLSIEYFLLTCSHESGRGSSMLENEGSGEGKGFIQLTGLDDETWRKLAVRGNQWRKACGKELLECFPEKDENKDKVDVKKVQAAVLVREQLAWEGSIYYWSVIPKAANNKEDLNYYVQKYECGYEAAEHSREGLYYATQCFVNGAYTGDEVSKIRAGNIKQFIIEKHPTKKAWYDLYKIGDTDCLGKAPVGAVGRAKYYMSYYDEEEIIWQFSQEILNQWRDIAS